MNTRTVSFGSASTPEFEETKPKCRIGLEPKPVGSKPAWIPSRWAREHDPAAIEEAHEDKAEC